MAYIIDGDELDIFAEPTKSGNSFIRVFRPRRGSLDNVTAAIADCFKMRTKTRDGRVYIVYGGGGGSGFATWIADALARRGTRITTQVF